MKNKPFQFRYVNEIVGGFVLLVVALLAMAIVVAGRAQGWFETIHRIHVDFPSEGSLDLQIGSPVLILGTTVGKVELIEVDELGFMTGVITVKDDFYQFVRTDSLAIVKKKFGIAGDAFIEITKGSGSPLDGAGLAPFKDTDLNELLQDLVTQLREAIMPLMDSVKTTVDEYGALAAGLSDPESPLQQMLANLKEITASIQRGEGSVGKLLSEDETIEALNDAVKQATVAIEQLQAVIEDVKASTAQLPDMTRKVGDELDSLPGTLLMTQEAIREAERLIEGVQQHWLLRGSMPPRQQPTELIPLYDISTPGPSGVQPGEESAP
jgi:phospholipid/cholesterol/gamma-HCH transport system substrate-binding protein